MAPLSRSRTECGAHEHGRWLRANGRCGRCETASRSAIERASASNAEHGRGKRRLEKDEYQVERIVGVRSYGGELQYLIKWKGWQPKFNTWEPLHHLKNLQSEIDSFEGSLKAAKFS